MTSALKELHFNIATTNGCNSISYINVCQTRIYLHYKLRLSTENSKSVIDINYLTLQRKDQRRLGR